MWHNFTLFVTLLYEFNWYIVSVKKPYTNIQSYISISIKVYDSITYYFKSLIIKSMWLDDSVKLFYTNNTSKLISYFIVAKWARENYNLSSVQMI